MKRGLRVSFRVQVWVRDNRDEAGIFRPFDDLFDGHKRHTIVPEGDRDVIFNDRYIHSNEFRRATIWHSLHAVTERSSSTVRYCTQTLPVALRRTD